jgi:hypothetical protein
LHVTTQFKGFTMSLTKASYSMINGAPVNVLDYGAKGDGTTNDYAAIVAAMNAGQNRGVYFPYAETGEYKFGTNLVVPTNVSFTFADGARLSPVAAQTITYQWVFAQPSGIYVSNLSLPYVVPAAVCGPAQFGHAFQIAGGDGTASNARVALYSAAQTGGGGKELVMAGNHVAQQNAADAMARCIALELDVNNNKTDDPLTPTSDEAHYALDIYSGGSKIVGPAAISVRSTSGLTNSFRRAIWIQGQSVTAGGFVINYDGNGTNQTFNVTDKGWIGVGTTSPNGLLSLVGTSGSGINITYSNQNINHPARSTQHAYATGVQTATADLFLAANGATVGAITIDSATTAYTSASDYRLKENVTLVNNSGAFIDALQPKQWVWKSNGENGVGFIAHEVQAISPSTVKGKKDDVNDEGQPVYQTMEYGSSEFIANIIAELKDVRKRLTELENKN